MPSDNYYQTFLSSFNSQKFQELRPAQEKILDAYAKDFKQSKDVAVELPTGAGKTLIALLIAEEKRKQDQKVAILSANKTLAHQLLREARELGIPVVLMEGKGIDIPSRDIRRYSRYRSIAIMNYWVYYNQNPVMDPADTLIMDDAHLAEHCLHSLYSVEITRLHHAELYEALVTELLKRFPEYSVLADALNDDDNLNTPPELLSFVDQVAVSDRLKEMIDASDHVKQDNDLKFRWRRVRNHLDETNIYFGRHSIWMRPYIYPLKSNRHYRDVKQTIYMSATIGDSGDLARRLGVNAIKKIEIDEGTSAVPTGRRLILMNRSQENDNDLVDEVGPLISAALRKQPKSVWLCSSRVEASKLMETVRKWLKDENLGTQPMWLLTSEGDEIDRFKESSSGHLFVAGRFDGMDFSGDECRLVILTTLPRAVNIQEEFLSAYLRDLDFIIPRTNQRIVQALGRCNRDESDYALYVLADARIATHFRLESNKNGLASNMVAEIDMAQDLSQEPLEEVVRQLGNFLNGEFDEYDEAVKEYLSAVPNRVNHNISLDVSNHEVVAWDAMYESQNYMKAEKKFDKCWEAAIKANRIDTGAFYGWQRAKALYLQSRLNEPSLEIRAIETLERAIQRGGSSAWFNRMRASIGRLRGNAEASPQYFRDDYFTVLIRRFDDLLDRLGTHGTRFERYCNRIEKMLMSDSHDEYQEGLEELGLLLGYQASRPKHSGATDCLWRGVFGSVREVFTLEAKIKDDASNVISLTYIGQAKNQRDRAETEYRDTGYAVRATIVTHLTALGPGVEDALAGIKIIERDAALRLWKTVRSVFVHYRGIWHPDDVTAKRRAGTEIIGRVPPTGWLGRALVSGGTFVDGDKLLAEWNN